MGDIETPPEDAPREKKPGLFKNALRRIGVVSPPKGSMLDKDNAGEPVPSLDVVPSDLAWRRLGAVCFAVVGIVTVAVCIAFAFGSFDAVLDKFKPATGVQTPDVKLGLAAMAGHAIVAVAAIYFAYQLLKAAERLLIPKHLYTGGREAAEVIRALTGIEEPTKFAAKHARETLEEASALTKVVLETVKSASEIGAAKPAPEAAAPSEKSATDPKKTT